MAAPFDYSGGGGGGHANAYAPAGGDAGRGGPMGAGMAHRSSGMYQDDVSQFDTRGAAARRGGGGGGGGGDGGIGSAFQGLGASNPMAAAGLSMGRRLFEKNVQSYIPGLTAFWESLHYYFDVDNKFVVNRLKCLLIPFAHTNWKRAHANGGGMDAHPKFKHEPPRSCMNAPDLYIPLMAFITFVLVTGLLKGTNMTFTPEVLGDVITASIVTQVLEIAVLKGAMWSTRTPAPPLLDLVAYTGYKYFGLTINTVMGMFGGALVYYVALLATGGTMACFMYQTLAKGCDMHVGTQGNYLAIGAAALQLVVMWWLGYSGDL